MVTTSCKTHVYQDRSQVTQNACLENKCYYHRVENFCKYLTNLFTGGGCGGGGWMDGKNKLCERSRDLIFVIKNCMKRIVILLLLYQLEDCTVILLKCNKNICTTGCDGEQSTFINCLIEGKWCVQGLGSVGRGGVDGSNPNFSFYSLNKVSIRFNFLSEIGRAHV